MDPYERWDDWEWEKAVQEVGGGNSSWNFRGQREQEDRKKSPIKMDKLSHFWTGGQKRILLAAFLFLTIFFSAQGEDPLSQGIYALYSKAGQTDYYTALTDMAKEAVGLGGMPLESMPVDATMKGKFLPPLSGPVEAGFGIKGDDGKVHEGIDVGSSLGAKVIAPYPGVVSSVGEDPQLGKIVKLDYGDGWTGVLGNLGDVLVVEGQKVTMGDQIGTVGLSAPLKKPWLHIELRKNNKPVNPIPYFIPTGQKS